MIRNLLRFLGWVCLLVLLSVGVLGLVYVLSERSQKIAIEQRVLDAVDTVREDGTTPRKVVDALDRHVRYLESSGELRSRRRARLRERVMEVVEQQLRRRLWLDQDTLAWIDERLDALEAGTQVPFAVADALRARSVALLTGAEYAPLQDG